MPARLTLSLLTAAVLFAMPAAAHAASIRIGAPSRIDNARPVYASFSCGASARCTADVRVWPNGRWIRVRHGQRLPTAVGDYVFRVTAYARGRRTTKRFEYRMLRAPALVPPGPAPPPRPPATPVAIVAPPPVFSPPPPDMCAEYARQMDAASADIAWAAKNGLIYSGYAAAAQARLEQARADWDAASCQPG